jgi:hypothetical protein
MQNDASCTGLQTGAFASTLTDFMEERIGWSFFRVKRHRYGRIDLFMQNVVK